MKIIKTFESFTHRSLVGEFVEFCCKELKIRDVPKISLQEDRTGIPTTAAFYPTTREIKVYCNGRHLVDILRSLAHEMVHLNQLERGTFDFDAKDIGGNQENEANAVAGQLIKMFSKVYPSVYESFGY